MGKYVYPVIFTPLDDEVDMVLIEAPDVNVRTQGIGLFDAIAMARDAISLTLVDMEDHHDPIPKMSKAEDIDVTQGTFAEYGTGYVSYVDVNTDKYREELRNGSKREGNSVADT